MTYHAYTFIFKVIWLFCTPFSTFFCSFMRFVIRHSTIPDHSHQICTFNIVWVTLTLVFKAIWLFFTPISGTYAVIDASSGIKYTWTIFCTKICLEPWFQNLSDILELTVLYFEFSAEGLLSDLRSSCSHIRCECVIIRRAVWWALTALLLHGKHKPKAIFC